MSRKLSDALGIDPTDPEWQHAIEDNELLMDTIAALVERRRELGMVQNDIAKLMETTQSAVSDFERLGGDPKLSTVQRYARALGGRLGIRLEERDEDGEWCEVSSGNLSGSFTNSTTVRAAYFKTVAPHLRAAKNEQFALSA